MGNEHSRPGAPDGRASRLAGPELQGADRALDWVELLSSEVGPRRPTSRAERLAAELMRQELARAGLDADVEAFAAYPTFAWPYGALLGASLLAGLMPRSRRAPRAALSLAAALGVALEGGLRVTPLSAAMARRTSQNVVATVEPGSVASRTVCLVGHLDTSRSGLMFHPNFVGHLNRWIAIQTFAALAQAADPVADRIGGGRAGIGVCRVILAAGLALLGERELRGVDVPGANDNASGAAVAAQLAVEVANDPLESTRVVLLLSGAEEAGTLGAQAFLRSKDTSGWLFLNFDSVGGPGTLRYLRREGVIAKFRSDRRLIEAGAALAKRREDLRMAPTDSPAGLTYDSSPITARGGRAMTLSTQDGLIPNLHCESDTFENVDRDGIERTLEAGRELLAAIDRGEADD